MSMVAKATRARTKTNKTALSKKHKKLPKASAKPSGAKAAIADRDLKSVRELKRKLRRRITSPDADPTPTKEAAKASIEARELQIEVAKVEARAIVAKQTDGNKNASKNASSKAGLARRIEKLRQKVES